MAAIVDRLFAIRRYTDRFHADPLSDVSRPSDPRNDRRSPTPAIGRGHDAISGDHTDEERSQRVAVDGGIPRFSARKVDTGLLVVADLRGVVRDDQQTEIDLSENGLVLTVDNRFAWRVPVDDGRASITDVSLKNDILEARVDVDE